MRLTGNGRIRMQLRLPVEVRALLVVLVGLLLYLYVRPLVTLVVLFVLGILLAAALHPPLTWLQERLRLPRGAVAALLAVLLGAIAAAALFWIVPVLLGQAVQLAESLPATAGDVRAAAIRFARRNPALAEYVRVQAARVDLQAVAARLLAQLGTLGAALGSAVLAGLLVLLVTLYSLLHPLPLVSGLLALVPAPDHERVAHAINTSLHQVRAWARGMAVTMLAVAALTTLALWLLRVPYALLFGVLAGLLEVVPTLGPILAAIPPVVVAFWQEPIRALWVALAFLAVQQIENNLLVPYIFAGALRIHPVLILFAVLVMGVLFGLLGVFVAIPLLAVTQAVVQELSRPAPSVVKEQAEAHARSALEMKTPSPAE